MSYGIFSESPLRVFCLPPSGDVSIGIKCAPGVVGPAEADIDFDIIKNDNDTFTVKYTPPGAGHYTIMVLFANQVPLHSGWAQWPHPPQLSGPQSARGDLVMSFLVFLEDLQFH